MPALPWYYFPNYLTTSFQSVVFFSAYPVQIGLCAVCAFWTRLPVQSCAFGAIISVRAVMVPGLWISRRYILRQTIKPKVKNYHRQSLQFSKQNAKFLIWKTSIIYSSNRFYLPLWAYLAVPLSTCVGIVARETRLRFSWARRAM